MRETVIREEIEQVFEDTVALRREIHMHPELSQHEERTMALVSKTLTGLGIPHRTGVGGYGVVAILGDEKADRAVAIRADMDALPIQEQNELTYASQVPGVMHACGHDMHTAILLGTAMVLKKHEAELPGAVKLFFQPAEEAGGGAKPMIEAGCMKAPEVKRVIGLHIDPTLPVGTAAFTPGIRSASSNGLMIRVVGAVCHGAQPQSGIDAILAASHVVTALQAVSSRMVSATSPVAVTIGKICGGTKSNIVAGEVLLEGTIRVHDPELLKKVEEKVRAVAESTAAVYGARAEVTIHHNYPALINDEAVTLRMQKLAEKLIGPDKAIFAEHPVMTSEDFSYFLQEAPGTFFDLGTSGPEYDPRQTLHSDRLCPDEACIRTGILLEAAGALDLLDELYGRKGD